MMPLDESLSTFLIMVTPSAVEQAPTHNRLLRFLPDALLLNEEVMEGSQTWELMMMQLSNDIVSTKAAAASCAVITSMNSHTRTEKLDLPTYVNVG